VRFFTIVGTDGTDKGRRTKRPALRYKFPTWATANAVKFQLGVTTLARSVGLTMAGLKTFVTGLLGEKAGPRWAYILRGIIWKTGVQEWMEPGRGWSKGLGLSDGCG
jgi:hypothetical protein